MAKKSSSGSSGCGCFTLIMILGAFFIAYLYSVKGEPKYLDNLIRIAKVVGISAGVIFGIYFILKIISSVTVSNNTKHGYTPNDFIKTGNRASQSIPGVYIIHNQTKNKYYVGQAKDISQRVGKHFTGRGGNPDVYYDYRNGDSFSVDVIPLAGSGYDSLDRLEKDMIKKYNSYENGYNKTRGNG